MSDPVTPEEARRLADSHPAPVDMRMALRSLASQLEAALERERKLWDEYRKHAIEWDEQGWKTQKMIDILEAEVEHGRDAFEAQLEEAQKVIGAARKVRDEIPFTLDCQRELDRALVAYDEQEDTND